MKDIKPWYQRWFGWMFPDIYTFEKTESAFWYVLPLVIGALLLFGYIFSIGYVISLAIGYNPMNGGIIAVGSLLVGRAANSS